MTVLRKNVVPVSVTCPAILSVATTGKQLTAQCCS